MRCFLKEDGAFVVTTFVGHSGSQIGDAGRATPYHTCYMLHAKSLQTESFRERRIRWLSVPPPTLDKYTLCRSLKHCFECESGLIRVPLKVRNTSLFAERDADAL